jgi:hypothetical protein
MVVLFQDEIIAQSVSTLDNVEHLHIPVAHDGEPGDYTIRVYNLPAITYATTYGLAWWTVPEPSTLVLVILALTMLPLRSLGQQ